MKKNILIVDDFANTLFVTAFTLKQAGFNVIKAASGKEALSIIRSDDKIDLIITDYNMPEMNGLQFIRVIKSLPHLARIPIFVLSTETKDEIRKEALSAGATLWLRKPFQTDSLVAYIKRVIDK